MERTFYDEFDRVKETPEEFKPLQQEKLDTTLRAAFPEPQIPKTSRPVSKKRQRLQEALDFKQIFDS